MVVMGNTTKGILLFPRSRILLCHSKTHNSFVGITDGNPEKVYAESLLMLPKDTIRRFL